MENKLEEISNSLNVQYFQNLEFLKINFPEIFEKVDKLSEKINNNSYQEKFSLEYKEEGYFDILNLETNEYLYGFNSFIEAEERTKNIDFSSKHSLNLLRIDQKVEKLSQLSTLKEANSLINYLNTIVDFKNIIFSKIFKFVYIGVGAGIHIHEIHKKIDSMNTLIIEPNLEIFRLSLFLLDYSVFTKGNKSLILSIDENQIERNLTFEKFEQIHSYMNYNIKHHLFNLQNEYLLKELIDFFSLNEAILFSYMENLHVFERSLSFIKRDFRFLQKELFEKKNILKDKEVLIIAAGPSLDKEIEWIKKNQDKFIIVSIDLILKKLEKNNIVPDIVISIDPKEKVIAHFFDTKDENFLKNSSIIFLSQQNEDVIEKVKHLNFYFSQVLPISEKIGYNFTIPNVGAFALAISLFLQANKLYIIGNDAAFDQETGHRYAKDNEAKVLIDKIENENNKDLVSFDDILEVPGNLKETVKTNRELYKFKKDYESFLYTYRKENKDEFIVYNLSDGAYIEGFTPLNTKDINIEKLQKKHLNHKDIEDVTTVIDDLDFNKDIEILTQIITKVKKFEKLKISSKNEFMEHKLDTMVWILKMKNDMSNSVYTNIFMKYLEVIDTYINFAINLKQDKTRSKLVLMNLKRFWCNSCLNLLRDIKKIISE